MCRQALQAQVVDWLKLEHFFTKQAEQGHDLVTDEPFIFRPPRSLELSAIQKNRVAFQFGHFERQFDLPDDGCDQFGDDRLAVRQGFGVGGHVARVPANVRDDKQHRFGRAAGMCVHLLWSHPGDG